MAAADSSPSHSMPVIPIPNTTQSPLTAANFSFSPNIPIIPTLDTTQPLLILNLSNHSTIKLNSTNYLSWQQQFASLLPGYDLQVYVDGTISSPPSTIDSNGISAPNPVYFLWHRQDRLVFTALLGSLSAPIAPLLHRATTSREAWLILANTYAKPSRGHIKQIKAQLKNPLQGSQTVSEFMQFVRQCADQLAILGKPIEEEDLVEKILDGLDAVYKPIVDAVNARDTPITFDELHEKLLNREVTVRSSPSPPIFPASAHHMSMQPRHRSNTPHTQSPPHSWYAPSSPRPDRPPPRPYIGYCQGCGTQGRRIKQCP